MIILEYERGKMRKEVVVAGSSMRTFSKKERKIAKKYSVAISVRIFEDRTK
jgi:siderophore synthetase component